MKTRRATGKSSSRARGGSAVRRPAPKAPVRKASAGRPKPANAPAPTTRADAPSGEAATVGGVRIRPLRDRILVRRLEETETRAGGIIVPDTAKEKPQQAEVIATGSGRVLENGGRVALSVRRGDRVLLGKWSGTEVKLHGEEYLILKEDEVLGILA